MPLDLKPGMTVPIPCRHGGQALIPFKVETGTHRLTCPRCGKETHVAVIEEGGRWRVRTEAQRSGVETGRR